MNGENDKPKSLQSANDFILELQKLHERYGEYIETDIIPEFYRDDQIDRRPPRRYKESSFLYIRSYDADIGNRPFSNQVFWLSPDILISPLSDLSAYTRTLNAWETYNIRCYLRNRGDRVVPSAKVEFWLTDPSLGFDTRYARHLTLGNVPTAWVNPNSTSAVDFTFPVPPTESGHKCLFARAFSFSPLEVPVEDTRLDPTIDRRVAQSNLNFVGQGQPYQFNWIHNPNARARIEFVPLVGNELFALRHPFLGDFTPLQDFPGREWVHRSGLELAETTVHEIGLQREPDSLLLFSSDPEAVGVEEQRELRSHLKAVLEEIAAGKSSTSAHRGLFARYREVNSNAQRSTFKMQIPDLGLERGQVVGLNVRAVEEQGELLGGLTLLITA